MDHVYNVVIGLEVENAADADYPVDSNLDSPVVRVGDVHLRREGYDKTAHKHQMGILFEFFQRGGISGVGGGVTFIGDGCYVDLFL